MRCFLLPLLSAFSTAAVGLSATTFDEATLAQAIAEVGPRSRCDPGLQAARQLLLHSMTDLQLEPVTRVESATADGWVHLSGHLAGELDQTIVLTAHYDTIAASSGLLDNASGCAVALGVISRLTGTRLRHGVQLLLTDQEERSAAGSRDWLAGMAAPERLRLVAHLNLDSVGVPGEGRRILHLASARGPSRVALSPAWLVHAVLQAAAAVDLPLTVLDPRWSWFAQLAVRLAEPTRTSDSRSFLAAGIPSVTLSDIALTSGWRSHAGADEEIEALEPARLEEWTEVSTAAIRRLDGLVARPAREGEYLVLRGRVFVQRDLLWLGFLLWVTLVWRGLPGRWREAAPSARRRAGRAYLPGFAFRMIFLLAVFLIPTVATLLLYPVAGFALVGAGRGLQARRVACVLGVLPTVGFTLWLTYGQIAGWFVLGRAALLPAILVLFTVASYSAWQLDPAR